MDTVGRVTRQGNRILRDISPEHQAFFRDLLLNRQVMEALQSDGLIATKVIESSEARLQVEHEFIERQTFWREWSFDMLKDAALLTVRLTKRLLTGGMTLKDAHPYNVLFNGCRPVFVDFGSIAPLYANSRKGWEQSFQSEFLLPLMCMKGGHKRLAAAVFNLEDRPRLKLWVGRLGVRLPPWRTIFPGKADFSRALDSLESWLVQLRVNDYGTTWEDYYARGQVPDLANEATLTNKERTALRFMSKTRADGCETLLDAASNEGWFANAAVAQGYKVIAFDYDERAINNLYLKNRSKTAAILPVVMDFRNPTRTHGIHNLWPEAQSRLACDVTLAMAIIHHLALGQGMAFADFAKRLDDLTRKYTIVEFIDPSDVHIRKKAKKRPWYTEANFTKAMEVHFEKIDESVSEPSTRKVFLYKKRN
jgi:hypothetical protein